MSSSTSEAQRPGGRPRHHRLRALRSRRFFAGPETGSPRLCRAGRALRPGAIALCAFLAASAASCSHGDAARGGAERFVDAYYVEIDLPRARQESVGLARAKVDDELKLLAGQEAPEGGSRPTVHYRLVESQGEAEHDRRGFVFELSIRSDGGDELTRRVLVTVRQDEGAWRAANFQEID